MKQNVNQYFIEEIAIRDKIIDTLKEIIKVKDEFIESQEKNIKMLKDHKDELMEIIESFPTLPKQEG